MKKYFFVGLVSAGMMVGIIIFVLIFLDLYKKNQKLSAELTAKKQDLYTLTDKLDKLKILKDREDQLREEEEVIVRAIPTKKEVGELFIQIDGLVAENLGILKAVSEGVAAVTPSGEGTTATIDGLSSAEYSFEATFPSYENFKSFLEKSQRALRFISLHNFNVTKTEESNFTVQLNYVAHYRSQ